MLYHVGDVYSGVPLVIHSIHGHIVLFSVIRRFGSNNTNFSYPVFNANDDGLTAVWTQKTRIMALSDALKCLTMCAFII